MRRHDGVAVELPVRIVAGEQQHAIGADLVDQILDAGAVGRRVERLRRQADVLAHQLRRRLLDPRHLDADALPGLVGAPHEGGQPADAGFHQHDLELREISRTRLRARGSGAAPETPAPRPCSIRSDRTASRSNSARCGTGCRHGSRAAAGVVRQPSRPASIAGGRAESSPCASTRIETKRLSAARRSISSIASSGSCSGITIEARSRGSRDSQSVAIQSLIALQNADAM